MGAVPLGSGKEAMLAESKVRFNSAQASQTSGPPKLEATRQRHFVMEMKSMLHRSVTNLSLKAL
jgi:hypothetical protein